MYSYVSLTQALMPLSCKIFYSQQQSPMRIKAFSEKKNATEEILPVELRAPKRLATKIKTKHYQKKSATCALFN